jgi:predicted amidohydrolase
MQILRMNVACVQFDIAWENKTANYARITKLLQAAHVPSGSLVLLPEMFACGFSMNVAEVAEEQGGATEQFLARTARDFGVFLMAGVVTRCVPDGGCRDAGEQRTWPQRMRHLFTRRKIVGALSENAAVHAGWRNRFL